MSAPTRLGSQRTAAATSVTSTISTGSTAGLPIIVTIGIGGSPTSVTGVTDTKSNTYVSLGSFSAGGGPPNCAVYACLSPAALTTSDTVTATYNTSNTAVIAVDQLSSGYGITLDGTATTASGTGTTATGGALTTTNATDILWAVIVTFGNLTITPAGGFTSTIVNGGPSMAPMYQEVSSTGTYTASGTWTGSQQWCVLTLALKTSSGAAASDLMAFV